MNQQLDSRADYYGSPLPRVAIAPSHTAPSQWRSSFLVDCTVEICLLLPIFAHLILNDPLRNARGNRGNRHFLTRPAREFFYHESPSIHDTPPIHTLSSIHLEAAVLGDPVPLDEDALVEAGVVQPRLHQAQRVVLQVVEQLHAPHAPSLRPHPVRDNFVEVAEEPEYLV